MGWQPRDLQQLDLPFSEEEIKVAILTTPKEQAPGPDGYIGLFFSECWEIIKQDIMAAIDQFYLINQQGMHYLNQAYVMLIPKKENPLRISDYRAISLTHSFAKLVSKLLATRLSPHLDLLISANQTTFIKKEAYMTILCMPRRSSRICTRGRFQPFSSNWTFQRLLTLLTSPTCSILCPTWGLVRGGGIGSHPYGVPPPLLFCSMDNQAKKSSL
jgi:hypothetical protein